MKESYGEGLANRTSLESCGDCTALAEALTEGSTGFAIELRNHQLSGADLVVRLGRQYEL